MRQGSLGILEIDLNSGSEREVNLKLYYRTLTRLDSQDGTKG